VQRPPKPKKLKKGQPTAPSPMTWRDKLVIWASLIGCFAIVLGWGHFYTTTKTARHLDQTINRWRTDFHLSPEQAERVRTIERNFHGSGNPFLTPAHTAEEVRVHHQEVAAAMNPADGERFLKVQEGREKHR
jgi:hypothetical protein